MMQRSLTSALRAGRSGVAIACGSTFGVAGAPPFVGLAIAAGPGPATASMLEVLRARESTATFFIRLDAAEARPDLVARVRSGGHEIGLRLVPGRDLRPEPLTTLAKEMRTQRRRLASFAGEPVRRQIAVYEVARDRFCVAARLAALPVVEPAAIAWDWLDLDETVAADRAVRGLRAGGMVVLHDGFVPLAERPEPTLDRASILQRILDAIEAHSWRAVSVDRLLTRRAQRRHPWFD